MSRGGAQSEQLQEGKNVEGIIQKVGRGIMEGKKGVATSGAKLGTNELPCPGTRDGGFLGS